MGRGSPRWHMAFLMRPILVVFILMVILMLIIALLAAVTLITPLPPGLAARCSPTILFSYIQKRNWKGLMILEDILFSLNWIILLWCKQAVQVWPPTIWWEATMSTHRTMQYDLDISHILKSIALVWIARRQLLVSQPTLPGKLQRPYFGFRASPTPGIETWCQVIASYMC
jgi:hypothetical protein